MSNYFKINRELLLSSLAFVLQAVSCLLIVLKSLLILIFNIRLSFSANVAIVCIAVFLSSIGASIIISQKREENQDDLPLEVMLFILFCSPLVLGGLCNYLFSMFIGSLLSP